MRIQLRYDGSQIITEYQIAKIADLTKLITIDKPKTEFTVL